MLASEAYLRALVATFFLMLAVTYSAKQMAMLHRDGAVPVHSGKVGDAQRGPQSAFRFARWALLAFFAARVPFPEIDRWVGSLDLAAMGPAGAAVQWFGAALMIGGAWFVIYCHNYMGALWRSGVPSDAEAEARPDALLQRGPFARARNPMFSGILIAHFGVLLAAPSLLLLISFTACAVALQRQAAVEERALLQRWGPSYAAYRARTPKWLSPISAPGAQFRTAGE